MLRQALALGVIALICAAPQDASAQGKGRPKRPDAVRTGAPTPASGSASAAASGAPDTQGPSIAFRQFGSWLDDASVLPRGEGAASVGAGYWRSEGGSQFDAPMLAAAYGVVNHLQLSATVPFYRVNYQGATASGLDDVYLSAKISALDPSGDRRFGVAISPTLEILSAGFMDDRVHWALPLSVEMRGGNARVYGSAGYFSRGAIFTGGAIEWTAPAGTVLTGAVTQSSSLSDAAPAGASGRGNRVDVSAGVAHPVRDAVVAYASVGRSLTSASEGGTSLAVSGGVSLHFARASSTP